MIFFKHSLITLTILVIAISVIPTMAVDSLVLQSMD